MQPYDISIFIDDESGDIQRESQIHPIVGIWSSGGANISKETIIKGLGKSGVTIPKGFF